MVELALNRTGDHCHSFKSCHGVVKCTCSSCQKKQINSCKSYKICNHLGTALGLKKCSYSYFTAIIINVVGGYISALLYLKEYG